MLRAFILALTSNLTFCAPQKPADIITTSATAPHPWSDNPYSYEKESPCPADLGKLPNEYRPDDRTTGKRTLVVFKDTHHIALYYEGYLVVQSGETVCIPVNMGKTPEGPKTRRDWSSTPEGKYVVHVKATRDSDRAYPYKTSFEQGLRIDYPRRRDIERAFMQGVIDKPTMKRMLKHIESGRVPSQQTAMGGDILIHSWTPGQYTQGCVGVDGAWMNYLFDIAEVGDEVLIIPMNCTVNADGAYDCQTN